MQNSTALFVGQQCWNVKLGFSVLKIEKLGFLLMVAAPGRLGRKKGKHKQTLTDLNLNAFVALCSDSQDYLVLLPEEYYRPRNLVVQVSNPCTLSRDERYCVHYTYPNLKQAGFITIQAEDSSVVGGIRRNRRVGDIPFQGLLLSGSRVSSFHSETEVVILILIYIFIFINSSL